MKKIIFVSSNAYKQEEMKELGKVHGLEIVSANFKINELQIMDVNALVKSKTFEAFKHYGCPVLVEHACLKLNCLSGLPGALTQLFWDILKDRICSIVNELGDNGAEAICTFGYCNGAQIFIESAEKKGSITSSPRGAREFQWDTIFVPEGYSATYAEMDILDKNKVSQRKAAFDKISKHIKG